MENGERSTTMTDDQSLSLVLKDEAGNYFLVPQETLERGRVPKEQKGEIERLVAEAAAEGGGGESVQGSVAPLTVAGAFAAEVDVSGHAIMIGGRWFASPAEDWYRAMMRTKSLEPPWIPGQPRE
jgi:hypothetical protein